jgi:hypothetical protein
MARILITLMALLLAEPAFSASLYKRALDTKKDQYLTSGVVIGGQAGAGFTLLNVRREHSNKLAMERIIFDLGNREGQPLLKRLGYFHVSVEKRPSRIVVDLSQVSRSRVSELELARLFAKSPFVAKVEMSMEPEDSSAKIVLNTKGPIAAEVFEMPSDKKASRIVIDLKKATR